MIDQINTQAQYYFLSSRGVWDPRVKPLAPLASFVLTPQEMVFQPPKTLPIYNFMRLKPFEDWWDEPVYSDNKGTTWNRKDLILTLRDKRGSHIDTHDEPTEFLDAYAGRTSGISKTKGSPLGVTVWHIGMEVVLSITKASEWPRSQSAKELWHKMDEQKGFHLPGMPWGFDPLGRPVQSLRFAWQAAGEPVPTFNDEPYFE